jgi:tRNA-dihydrouridine synthase B
LVEEAGVAAISFHPRHASQHHTGSPDYDLAAELVEVLPAPVLLTGGLSSAEKARVAYERTGAAALLLARGSLGNPWIFGELLGTRSGRPSVDEVATELIWVIDRAEEHFGAERAGRWLRKCYPWYSEGLGLTRKSAHGLCTGMGTGEAREFLAALGAPEVASGTLADLSYA